MGHDLSECAREPHRLQHLQVEQEGDGSWLYGNFIHPWSSTQPNGLYLIISNFTSTTPPGGPTEGFASTAQYVGTL